LDGETHEQLRFFFFNRAVLKLRVWESRFLFSSGVFAGGFLLLLENTGAGA
jgi:hypothetical protein